MCNTIKIPAVGPTNESQQWILQPGLEIWCKDKNSSLCNNNIQYSGLLYAGTRTGGRNAISGGKKQISVIWNFFHYLLQVGQDILEVDNLFDMWNYIQPLSAEAQEGEAKQEKKRMRKNKSMCSIKEQSRREEKWSWWGGFMELVYSIMCVYPREEKNDQQTEGVKRYR